MGGTMKDRGAQLRAWLFVLPALILLAAYLVYPTIQTFRVSLFGGTGFNPTRFVGLKNYADLLTHDSLFLSLRHWPPSGALVNNILWLILLPVARWRSGCSLPSCPTGYGWKGS